MTTPVPVPQTKLSTRVEVQSRFAAWRKSRQTGRSAIPAELWSAAVMLAMSTLYIKFQEDCGRITPR